MKKVLPLILAFIMLTPSFAQKQGQEKIDSLLAELPNAKEDTNKVKLLNNLSYSYHSINPDIGIKYGEKAISLSHRIGWSRADGNINNYISMSYETKGAFDTAMKFLAIAEKIFINENDKKGISRVYLNQGRIFGRKRRFSKSFKNV